MTAVSAARTDKVKAAIVSRSADKWYVCFQIEVPEPVERQFNGVDLGGTINCKKLSQQIHDCDCGCFSVPGWLLRLKSCVLRANFRPGTGLQALTSGLPQRLPEKPSPQGDGSSPIPSASLLLQDYTNLH
jgi:hypothetical protein